jgi:hypothetical protein
MGFRRKRVTETFKSMKNISDMMFLSIQLAT